MEKNYKIPPEKLREFTAEHLYYEIDMLYGVSRILWTGVKDIYLYNALLESFVIHASIIVDFFYKPQMKPDDAKAPHFVQDIKAWKEALPPVNKYFRQFNQKRNKRVMHLSYSRLQVQVQDKKWDTRQLVPQIKKIVDLFLDHADPRLVHPKLFELRNTQLRD